MYRYRDNSGCTRLSIDRAAKHLAKIGRIVRIEGKRWRGKYGIDEAVLTTGSLGTIRLSGFLWGYGGEGPRGLTTFLVYVGLPAELAKQAANSPRLEDLGVDWTLTHGVVADHWSLARNRRAYRLAGCRP